MKKIALILLLICTGTLIFGQAKQTITSYSVSYKIKHLGFGSTGKFNVLSGDIHFDAAHLNTSSIRASIETNSFDSNNKMRDKDLKSDSYFDVARYPKITMRSVSFVHTAGDNYLGEFNLTLKGVTKLVELPFIYTLNGTTGKFSGIFTINRLDYGVGSKSLMMGNDVTLFINITTAVK
jgi:polyisoprenoid-binding protein YceI